MKTIRLRAASAFLSNDGRTVLVSSALKFIAAEERSAAVTFHNQSFQRAHERPSLPGRVSELKPFDYPTRSSAERKVA